MNAVITYILTAMLSWVPVRNLTPYGETEDDALARMRSIAEDIVTVAFDPLEPPTFAHADGRIKTALLQAAISSFEGGYQKFVDDGTCNKAGYAARADRRGTCDGGHAYSIWQIHVAGSGYLLLEDGSLGSVFYSPAAVVKAHEHDVVRGPELIADRKTAARIAQRIERDSLRQHHSLCSYSGESCEDGGHPKAKARLDRAMIYFAQHPYTDAIPEVVVASN
jgi:hypothetical protein